MIREVFHAAKGGRRHPFIALEEQTISSMLHPLFPDQHLESFKLLTAGHCNTNYTFTIAGLNDRFVLRVYVRDRQACQKDRDLFQLIRERVPIPELLYTHIGNQSISNVDSIEKSNISNITYAVMKWVNGELFSDILARRDMKAIPECAYDIGRILATIGSYTFPLSGFFGPELTIAEPLSGSGRELVLSYLENLLFQQRTGQRLSAGLTTRLWKLVNKNTAYLDVLDGVASLVHSDFKGLNILVCEQQNTWHVSAVLDWEFAFAGSPFFDIGNMLRYDGIHPFNFVSEFIRGYKEHGGQLPSGWKRTAKLVDLMALCEFMNSPEPRAAMLNEVTALLVGTLERWEKLGED